MESEDIGALTKIRIGHDNSGFGAAWFLDKVRSLASTNISSNLSYSRSFVLFSLKVEISRIKPEEEKPKKKKNRKKSSGRHSDDDEDENKDENDYEYLFLCNRWLAKNEDDGEIVRELVPSTKSGLKRRNTLSGSVK